MKLPEYTLDDLGTKHRGQMFHVPRPDQSCRRVFAIDPKLWLTIDIYDTLWTIEPHVGPMHWEADCS